MSEIQEKVLRWIARGRVGLSSKAMAMAACGVECDKDYPLDPDDLNRCLLMLEDIPEVRDQFDRISELSPVWRRLISRWQEIESLFLDEAGLNWSKDRSAPNTYSLMKKVIGDDPSIVRFGNVGLRVKA